MFLKSSIRLNKCNIVFSNSWKWIVCTGLLSKYYQFACDFQFIYLFLILSLQPDQINMAVLFWYLVKSDASVRFHTLTCTGQVTFYKVPEKHGHVQCTLYLFHKYSSLLTFLVHKRLGEQHPKHKKKLSKTKIFSKSRFD